MDTSFLIEPQAADSVDTDPVHRRVLDRDHRAQPSWVEPELPAAYAEVASKIAALRAEARQYEQFGAVLWQTGEPLRRAVCDIFAALQFETELMAGHLAYDVRVQLDAGRRLLVGVVGDIEGVHKKSPQIARILQALQEDAAEQDRLIVATNSYCDIPLASRRQEPVAPDALRLIQRIGANVVTTATLFGIWKYSLGDLNGARKSVIKLHTQDGGVFK